MHIALKNGQREVLNLDCKKVVITITYYRTSSKRTKRLKIKAKGKCPQANQARL